MFRSAQLNGDALRTFIQENGVRTVVNLRGCCMYFDWYHDECRANQDLNVSQEDITLSANRLPAPSEMRRLIEVLDRTEYPILLHCRQGADRTGLASAIYMLLYTDAEYSVARRQCGARYAHVPVLSTVNMDRFFDMYEAWLKNRSLLHKPDHFRQWALHEYHADPAPALIELVGPLPIVTTGEPLTLRIRAHNLSGAVWEFKPGTGAAVHVRYFVYGPDPRLAGVQRAGLFDARVSPGESIEIDLPFPPLQVAGTYKVNVDMADKQLNFCQLGSEFLTFEIWRSRPSRKVIFRCVSYRSSSRGEG